MDWIKQDDGNPDHPMRDPAAAAKLLAELRGADPLAALNDLTAWLDASKDIPGRDEQIRSEILSLIQEASDPHVSALLAHFFARQTDKKAGREPTWYALSNFLRALVSALCASAAHLLKEAAANPSLRLPGAAGAARGLHACRSLVKVYLMRYLSVPPKMWRMAYAIHREAEAADCAEMPVHLHAAQKIATTVTQELLRLLMLQSCSPETMAPGQIEAADWVIEQLGGDFTLRPTGVADNPFCFDPASDAPPRRASGQTPDPGAGIRYFGAGLGYDTLERIYKQMATTKNAHIKTFGKVIAPHVQVSAVQHLLAFWAAASPYTPPARSPRTGTLQVIHGYAETWQYLSRSRSSASELTLAEDGDVPTQTPESWTLQDVGGNELGVEIPQASGDWVHCGDVVSVSTGSNERRWLGVIRSMHAESGRGMHADIYVMSSNPQALQLRAVIPKNEENAFSEQSARQFSFHGVRAIILSDGSAASQPPNMLLPPDSWKEGRVFEATVQGAARYLRVVRPLRRDDDYLHATFEWVAQA